MSIKIGDNIANYRKKKGLTQEELGELLNISGQAVSKWENGGVPDIYLLPEIAKIFDVSIDSLFGCKKKVSEITKDEILNELFKYSSYNNFYRKGEFDAFRFLFEAIWSIQCAYLGNEELYDYKEIIEKHQNNSQITSQIINDEGTTYLSLVKDFPFFCAVSDSSVISQKLLNEEKFCEFFSVFAKEYGLKAILFTQTASEENQYTDKAIAEKIGITESEFAEICPVLVKYGFLQEELLLLDDKKVKIYNKRNNPEIRPLLMLAYQFINARQCYYNFMSNRTKPYLELQSDKK